MNLYTEGRHVLTMVRKEAYRQDVHDQLLIEQMWTNVWLVWQLSVQTFDRGAGAGAECFGDLLQTRKNVSWDMLKTLLNVKWKWTKLMLQQKVKSHNI